MDFKVGELYFMLWHADDAKQYPNPDAIVFIGKNLEEGVDGEAWYFQDVDSFCTHGPYSAQLQRATDVRLFRLNSEDLSQVLDSVELSEELMNCATLRGQRTAY